jgi:tetratricopeptide (TPR) repeat protein
LRAFGELAQKIRGGQSFSGRERNCAFLNTGDGRFADVSAVTGLDFDDDARGLATSDLDGDGDADIVLSNRTAPVVRVLRNDMALASTSRLVVQLTGTSCNRDAIGASVSVQAGGRRASQTVVAGDGFLSQSGKALIFGLGAARVVERVLVRWPGGGGGKEEEFTGVGVNGVWKLVQGAGRAVPLERPVLAAVTAAPTVVPPAGEAVRIRLFQPLPVPAGLAYRDLGGRDQPLAGAWCDGPVLIHLWATWCAPCAAELQELAALQADLRLLPLSVEQLSDDPPAPAPEAVHAFLAARGLTDHGGWATRENIAAFDQLVRDAVYHHLQMPLPASFLVTKEGRVAVIYKGRTTAAQVRQDLATLNAGTAQSMAAAVPFPGRWARATAFASHPAAVARAFLEAGEPLEAESHLRKFIASQPEPATEQSRRQRVEVMTLLAETSRLRSAWAAAEQCAREALRYQPAHIPAVFELAQAQAAQSHIDQALATLRPLCQAGPARLDALDLSADVQLAAGRSAAAAADWRAALTLNPKFIPALQKLARLLAAADDVSLRQPEEALRLATFLLSAPGARQQPVFLASGAAAYAACGRFPEAVAMQADAVRRLGGAGQAAAFAVQLRILQAYQDGRPPSEAQRP